MALSDIVRRVQVELGDPAGKLYAPAYIKGFVPQACDDLASEVDAIQVMYDEKVVTLSNVPANTTDLSTYQATGQALENMEAPISLEWRRIGESDVDWKDIPPRDKVVDVDSVEGIRSYEWRNSIIYISPSDSAVDIRVRFDALNVELVDDTDKPIAGTANVLVYWITYKIASADGELGSVAKLALANYERTLDNFLAKMTKNSQKIERKFGRANRSQRSRLYWTIPIS